VIEQLRGIINYSFVRIGAVDLTLGVLLFLTLGLTVLFLLAGQVHRLVTRSLGRTRLDLGAREAVGSIARYVFLLLGFLVILQTAGINLTAITVLAGAVGIGVGFGLQTIASNFISGLIIMFERPIKVGDRIEVAGVHGRVIHIGARATTILTNDNISVIVPNASFIAENVVNWTHSGEHVRFRLPVSVAYGTDVRLVERVLLEVAANCPAVLAQPAPAVRFLSFGDSGLEFDLRVWNSSLVHQRAKLVSDLNFLIDEAFRAHGIEIPFPQRDVHIRSGLDALGRD
jgi:small-conductance mechanosensitive channel